MSLDEWLKNSWVVRHQTSPQEIANLLALSDRDIHDCRAEGLSPDWKMNIAYNAALQAATAALAANGYRVSRDSHHFRIIQSLRWTINPDESIIIQFELFRKKRNIVGYEQAGTVSRQEAEEMLILAKEIRDQVTWWIKANHKDLMK